MSEFQGRIKKLNVAAWLLSFVVIVVGVVMYLYTDRPFFLVFVGLGVLTVINVVVYDNLILKPQLRAEAAKKAAEEAESPDSPAHEETQK